MGPLTVLVLAGLAAGEGAALGRSEGILLRRASGVLATSAVVDAGVQRLHWLAPAVAITLAVRTATSSQPSVTLALVPLAVLGPWLVAVQSARHVPADRGVPMAAALTANGAVLASAFTGRPQILVSAFLAAVLPTGIMLLAQRLSPGFLGTAEVKIAAVVGLATGTLGWPAVALALAWTAGTLGLGRALRRWWSRPLVPALLAGGWVAALAAL